MEIIIKNLSFSYNKVGLKNIEIFNDISTTIEKGSITSFIGSQSSGITTLFELLTNELIPSKGAIINNISNKKIGYSYQLPDEQFFNDDVYNELRSYIILNDVKRDIKKRINDSLKLVGLNIDVKRKINTLSQSEKRKLSFACSLVHNPDIIIFDDPTVGLDSKEVNEFIKLVRLLKKRYNKTIIISSNDIDFIHYISDKIIVIDNKKIILEGKKYEVFSQEKIFKYIKISLPKTISFSNYVLKNKKIKLGYRDEINDLIKDIYRKTEYKKEV